MKDLKKYKVLIAEDSFVDRRLLELFIKEREEIELSASVVNGAEVLKTIEKENFDLLILDINMPEYSGIEILDKLDQTNLPFIIFATSDNSYALKAFEYGALDYLLKPFNKNRFDKSIDRFLTRIRNKDFRNFYSKEFSFKSGNKHYTMDFSEIVYISSNGKKSVIHGIHKDYEISMLLKSVMNKMPSPKFIRVHKQHIVNTRFMHGVKCEKNGSYILYLNDDDDTVLNVGRSYVDIVKTILGME